MSQAVTTHAHPAHGSHHHHHHHRNQQERDLWLTLLLTASFMLVEVGGGVWTHSLALLSDAAHMLTDVASLAIALAAIRIGQRAADTKRTYGYYRLEVLAATFNAVILFLLSSYIMWEGVQRFWRPQPIQSTGMLLIAGLGLLVNAACMWILRNDHDDSLNVKSAYLEVWSDFISSIGVVLGAAFIYWTGWRWIDPMIAVGIGLWVLPRAWALLTESVNVLLEGVPQGLELQSIRDHLLELEGVVAIHDLHVWAITSGQISLTAHLLIDREANAPQILQAVNHSLADIFHINHTTIQMELDHCQVACDQLHTNQRLPG